MRAGFSGCAVPQVGFESASASDCAGRRTRRQVPGVDDDVGVPGRWGAATTPRLQAGVLNEVECVSVSTPMVRPSTSPDGRWIGMSTRHASAPHHRVGAPGPRGRKWVRRGRRPRAGPERVADPAQQQRQTENRSVTSVQSRISRCRAGRARSGQGGQGPPALRPHHREEDGRARPEGRWSAAGDSAAYASKTASSPSGAEVRLGHRRFLSVPTRRMRRIWERARRGITSATASAPTRTRGFPATGGVGDDPRGPSRGSIPHLGGDGQAASASPWEVPRAAAAGRDPVLMPPGCTVVTPMPVVLGSPAIDSEEAPAGRTCLCSKRFGRAER